MLYVFRYPSSVIRASSLKYILATEMILSTPNEPSFFSLAASYKSEKRVSFHGSSKPGNLSLGRFSRPLLEVYNALIIPPSDNICGGGQYD